MLFYLRKEMSLAQKTALITGATRGIGLQIAKSFADQGAKTILIGRDSDDFLSTKSLFFYPRIGFQIFIEKSSK